MKTGVELIKAERARQKKVEGWSAENDDRQVSGEMNDAAICYAGATAKLMRGESLRVIQLDPMFSSKFPFPYEDQWWKPSDDPIRNLVKAGALIAAEIDRLQRKMRNK